MDADRLAPQAAASDGACPSAEIADFIRAWEDCSLVPYLDVAGKCTVGYGHLLEANEPRVPITQAQADKLFERDYALKATEVARMVTIPLERHQFEALCSFAFNLGAGALRNSTLLRLVNLGQFVAAGYEFRRWVWATVGGVFQEVDGLKKRRDAERAIFERADYSGRP